MRVALNQQGKLFRSGRTTMHGHLRCPLLSAGSAIQNQLGPIHPVA